MSRMDLSVTKKLFFAGVDTENDSVVCEVPFGGVLLINNVIPHRRYGFHFRNLYKLRFLFIVTNLTGCLVLSLLPFHIFKISCDCCMFSNILTFEIALDQLGFKHKVHR